MVTDSEARDDPREIPKTVLTDLMASPRRRYVIERLSEAGEAISVDDLATDIVASETGRDPESVSASERRAVVEDLYQTHLPKLTATDVVEFDSMRGALELGSDVTLQASATEATTEGPEEPFAERSDE